MTYTFTFSNAGGFTTGVTIQANTPAGTTFVSAEPAAASDPGAGGTGTVTWNVADLGQGNGGEVTMTVELDSPLAHGTVIDLTGYTIS